MPNVGTVLREEIGRVARREIRKETESTKKATTQHRHAIAALKGHVAKLERQVAVLTKSIARARPAPAARDSDDALHPKIRFSPKGLHAHRTRLGISANDFGKLVGVSAQSVYNWEQGQSVPRAGQLAKIAAVRKLGKREVARRLEAA